MPQWLLLFKISKKNIFLQIFFYAILQLLTVFKKNMRNCWTLICIITYKSMNDYIYSKMEVEMKVKNLILKKNFDRIISTRVAIENLFDFDVSAVDELTIDFSDITFISSSAAHQLVLELRKLKDLDIEINLLNVNEDVQRMINIAKTDRKNIFTTQPIEVLETPGEKELDEFLK